MKIAVFISGGGTTLKNLIRVQRDEALPVEIALVISSAANAAGIQFANDANIPVEVVRRQDYATGESFSAANFDLCRNANIDLVVLGGYLKHVLIPADFENRVMNIHPSLIPAFSGKGFYGAKVHEAVLQHGCKITGCTVHFVDNEFDHGPIISQDAVWVRDDDTPKSLAARVFEIECTAYPEAIRHYVDGKLSVSDRKVTLRGRSS